MKIDLRVNTRLSDKWIVCYSLNKYKGFWKTEINISGEELEVVIQAGNDSRENKKGVPIISVGPSHFVECLAALWLGEIFF